MLKRTIVVLAAMAVLIGLLPVAAFAGTPGATDVQTVIVTITGDKLDDTTGVVVKAGSKKLSIGAADSDVYNAVTDVDTWQFNSATELDYDGNTTNDFPQVGDAYSVEVTVGDDVYYYTGTLALSFGNTANISVAKVTGASLTGQVAEDNQAKGATGDNVYTAGSDTAVSGTSITIYKGGVMYATTTSTSGGTWTTIVGAGSYTVKADITGAVSIAGTDAEFLDADLCDTPASCPASPTVDQADEGEVQWFGGTATATGASSVTVTTFNLTGVDIVYDNDSGVDANTWDHIDVLTGAFKDTAGHWANTYIADLKGASIVSGDSAGNFNPESNLTRAEFAKMLYIAHSGAGSLPVVSSAPYPDVSTTYWAAPYIQALKAKKIVGGDSAGNFNPDANITRAEAIVMVVRAAADLSNSSTGWVANLTELTTDGTDTKCSEAEVPAATLSFVDVPTTYWAANHISWLFVNGEVSGNTDGTFAPDANITRAEMAKILSNVRTPADKTCS